MAFLALSRMTRWCGAPCCGHCSRSKRGKGALVHWCISCSSCIGLYLRKAAGAKFTGTRTGERSDKHYNYVALRVRRNKVQMASLEEAKAEGIEVHFRMKLTDLRWDDTGVKFTFANGHHRS